MEERNMLRGKYFIVHRLANRNHKSHNFASLACNYCQPVYCLVRLHRRLCFFSRYIESQSTAFIRFYITTEDIDDISNELLREDVKMPASQHTIFILFFPNVAMAMLQEHSFMIQKAAAFAHVRNMFDFQICTESAAPSWYRMAHVAADVFVARSH